jgi:uncharacterized protein (TIGR03083 family)
MSDEDERLALLKRFSSVARDISALVGSALPESWSQPSPYSLGGGRPWTTKDLLAHLVSIQGALPAIIRSGKDPAELEHAPFDPDRWNEAMLHRRLETPPWSLLEEMVEATDDLDEAFFDVDLDVPARIGWQPGRTLRVALGELADHQLARLEDLRRAMGFAPVAN